MNNYNCKDSVYIQPPKGALRQKCSRHVHFSVPMLYKSEQKLSYINHPIQKYSPTICSSTKTSCLQNNLKLGFQNPLESIQYSSYRKLETSDKLIIKKPEDCVNLLGRGLINLNTSQQIEFPRKIINQQNKHYRPSCHIFKLNTPSEGQSIYHTSYEIPKIEKESIDTFKPKNYFMTPVQQMDTTTTNNISYKYWAGSSNNSCAKNNYKCTINPNNITNYQTTYNYCYSAPGTYSKETKFE